MMRRSLGRNQEREEQDEEEEWRWPNMADQKLPNWSKAKRRSTLLSLVQFFSSSHPLIWRTTRAPKNALTLSLSSGDDGYSA